MNTRAAVLLALLAIGAASCGSGSSRSNAPPPDSTTHVVRETEEATLTVAARRALAENYRLSVYVLWNNQVPSWATESTRGPALASLRAAAANRRARGIRLRMLSHRRVIVSLAISPSYTSATAIVLAHERVQPSGRDGQRVGRTIQLRERGRFILHRTGTSRRFVVWRVAQLP